MHTTMCVVYSYCKCSPGSFDECRIVRLDEANSLNSYCYKTVIVNVIIE